jgi:hypothetical protein
MFQHDGNPAKAASSNAWIIFFASGLQYKPSGEPYIDRKQSPYIVRPAGQVPRPSTANGRRSSKSGDVAQLVERLLCKQDVRGSSPLISTKTSGFGRVFVAERLDYQK